MSYLTYKHTESLCGLQNLQNSPKMWPPQAHALPAALPLQSKGGGRRGLPFRGSHSERSGPLREWGLCGSNPQLQSRCLEGQAVYAGGAHNSWSAVFFS